MRHLSLVLVGAISAAAWRLEVEYHGFAGLGWLGYFHWAIPLGAALFAAWAALVADVGGPGRRAALAASLLLAAVPLYAWTRWTLALLFITGPAAFVARASWWGPLLEAPALVAALAALPVVPAAALLIVRRFGVRPSWRRLLAAAGSWYAAPILAMALLRITGHPGGSDLIHAIKSGFVVPFLVGALGVMVVARR
jgi:hypothetical protein